MALWQDINLDRHAVIEASAGTGKTYTIERLVLRLLMVKEDASIDRLLILTFTEKAAGELKDRIRSLLHRTMDGNTPDNMPTDDSARARLHMALENFDTACISTIHGFCHQALQEYAFENNQIFDLEVCRSDEVYEHVTRNMLRKDWPKWYGNRLEDLLRETNIGQKPEEWLYTIVHIAESFRGNPFDQLKLPDDDTYSIIADSIKHVQQAADTFKQRHGLITYDDMLRRLDQALDADMNPEADHLVMALRQRYRYALVDEFQDTDPIQWHIFRRIFVDDTPEHRIFVVGDPKQAIYAFRGADIYTYMDACAYLLSKNAERYSLDTNYRSSEDLIRGFNGLFGTGRWFPADASLPITCNPVQYPVDEKDTFSNSKVHIVRDNTGRKAVTCMDLSALGKISPTLAVWHTAHAVVNEINRLLQNPEQFQFIDPETRRARHLQAGDICILLQKHRYKKYFEGLLRERNIPYTLYKQPGLYQSSEALHLSFLLQWLTRPEDVRALKQALLTRFFAKAPEDILQHALLSDPVVQTLQDRWQHWCAQRQWPHLFDSLLTDTGLRFREARTPDADRRLTNFEHLFQELTQAAFHQHLDITGLYNLLEQRRRHGASMDQDADLHRMESDTSKVQIMTMHAAKGLQFPLVFIADGFSDTNRQRRVITYHDEHHARVFEIEPNSRSPGKTRARQESRNELRRLYYVATTRARYKVWFPVNHQPKSISFSPVVNLYSANAEHADAPYSGILPLPENPFGDNKGQPTAVPGDTQPAPDPSHVEIHTVPALGRHRRFVDSFSGLAHHAPASDSSNTYSGERREGEQDEVFETVTTIAAATVDLVPETGSLLPLGKRTGNAFHDLMEALTIGHTAGYEHLAKYDSAKTALEQDPAIRTLTDRVMKRYRISNHTRNPVTDGLPPDARHELIDMARQALQAPILDHRSCLADIPAGDRRAEMEFFLQEGTSLLPDHAALPDWRRGLLNGFIDLLFRYKGKYYILDWKTNSLDDYSADRVATAMQTHNYHLQYRIYSLALREWLARSGQAHPDKMIGGTYYLFVRGMRADNAQQGVFREDWSPDKAVTYRHALEQCFAQEPHRTIRGDIT
jgi:exodeoxyribonuclease V beta subunit